MSDDETRPRSALPGMLRALWRIGLLGLSIVLAATLVAVSLVPVAGTVSRAVTRVHQKMMGPPGEEVVFPRFPERSTIHAADGSVLAKLFFNENRKIVRLQRIPKVARRAVLAIEDQDFYSHPGIDLQAVIRALLENLAAGEVEQGASTITQQLARNAFPEKVGSEETVRRKMREARMAFRIEQEYSKDEILELYLNEVFLGHGIYGMATAAEFYFGKHVGRLKLPEAALLAGMISAPQVYSPLRNRQRARARRDHVIDRMVELGWIEPDRAARAKQDPLGLSARKRRILRRARTPFFVEFIKQQILELRRFGKTREARIRTLFQGGLQIYTTLDPDLQRMGRRAIREHLPLPQDPQGAIVAVRPHNGAVRALIGGTDFRKQKFNLATQARRQAGSAFKPFTLVTALRQGISPLRRYDSSSPKVIPMPGGQEPWEVRNAGRRGYGNIDLRTATRNSVNVVYAQLIMDVGPRAVVQTAKKMGIESHLPAVPSLTLGTAGVSPLEMASAFSTLANAGVHCEPFAIRRIVDRDGEIRMKRTDAGCDQAISPDVANRAVAMLRQVVEAGTGTAARIDPWPVFGKTGTTDDYGDAWFVGCAVQLCAASWVGHPEGRIPMTNVHGIRVFGGTFPARIWRDFMAAAMQGRPVRTFPEPPPIPPPLQDEDPQTTPPPEPEPPDEESSERQGGGAGDGDGSGDGGDGDSAPSPEPDSSPPPEPDSSPEPEPSPTTEPGPTSDP